MYYQYQRTLAAMPFHFVVVSYPSPQPYQSSSSHSRLSTLRPGKMLIVKMAHSRDVLDKIADSPAKLNLVLDFLSSYNDTPSL